MVHLTIRKVAFKKKMYGKNQGPNSIKKKVISLLSLFRNKQTDIVANRGNVCNQKGCLMVYLIIGKFCAKT